jgi:putative addiction module component (TIGR02574 family)
MATRLQDIPIDARIKLVEGLWDSIAAEHDQLPLTAPQQDELDSRLDGFELDGDVGEPAGSVLVRIRQVL